MAKIIDYGTEVDFDPTSFTPPVALATSAVGTVERVFVMSGTPSTSQINQQVEFGER